MSSTLKSVWRRKDGWVRKSDIERIRVAQLRLAGFVVTAEYILKGDPDSAIVNDQRCMDWMFRTMSDDEVDTAFHAEKEAERVEAHADLVDPARANAGWKYAFTRSHSVTRYDAPTSRRARSGFRIEKVI
jgi:hypothetical protein